MALPKRRTSHSKVRTRQQQWRAAKITTTKCPHCTAVIVPHRACMTCGYYNGRAVMPPRAKHTPHPGGE